MKHKKDAVIMLLVVLIIGLITASAILYDHARDVKSDFGKLILCWEEYNAVDRSIEQCIVDQQGTLVDCLQEWEHKFALINEVGCPI